MCQIMHSWEQHCCHIPTTGPSSQPPWITPCGSTAPSAVTSGCCTSVRAPGQVSVVYSLSGFCFVTKQSVFGCVETDVFTCFVWHRGKQRAGSRAHVEKRWSAGCFVFSGGSPESETCHTAQQTISTFCFSMFF